MKISATQLDTVLDPESGCQRKWWFSYKRKLPIFKRSYFGVGSVLHGCCERYLLGADDPFTEGWMLDPDTKKSIAPADAGLVKLLVEKGIEAGFLERRPGQLVEQWFSLPVEGIDLVGKKDVESPARIEDHKTSKSPRYLKSKEKLRTNLQLLIYAYELLWKSRKRGEQDPRIITLAHNQFITDPENPEVRRREAEVTPDEVDAFWNNVVRPGVRKIKELSTVEDPWTIPDPDKRACQAYGGCPFQTMCSGSEDILTYSARITNMSSQPMASPLDQFLKTRAAGIPPASQTPAVNPPQTAAPAAAVAPAVVAKAAPPWAVPQCDLCSHTATPGFHPKKGTPCRICLAVSKLPMSDYDWKIEADGKATWWKKGEKVTESEAPAPVENTGSKAAYTSDALYAKLKACGTIEAIVDCIKEAEGVFGVGSVDAKTFAGVADARMEEIDAEVEPPPSAAELAKPSAKPILVNVAVGDKIVQMTQEEAAKHQAAPAPAQTVVLPPLVPADPKPEEPPKRPRGRPRMLTPGAAVVSPKMARLGEEALAAINGGPTEVFVAQTGFVLLLGCSPMGGTSFPGMEMQFAEDFLSAIPGYWGNDNVFDRRQKLRKAFMEDQSMREGLNGRILVQTTRDPDVDNLMSTLLGCKPALVLRGTM